MTYQDPVPLQTILMFSSAAASLENVLLFRSIVLLPTSVCHLNNVFSLSLNTEVITTDAVPNA